MAKFFKTLNILYERLLLIVLIIILLIVLWCMYDNYYVFSHTSDRVAGYRPGSQSSAAAQGDKQITDDMCAWITIDDTNIDYPIMQGTDNVKYLNTDPFGDYSLAGSIFLDSRNSNDFTDSYSLIYGHHMEYGRMFGALDDFLDEKYLKNHSKGTLLIGRNGEETHSLRIFASLRASAQDEAVFDPSKNNVREYIALNSAVLTEPINGDQRILGLSTCTEGDSSARIVVFCYIED